MGAGRGGRARALVVWGLGAAALVLAVLGSLAWTAGERTSQASGEPSPSASAPGPSSPVHATTRPAVRAPDRPGAPRRVVVPALAIDAPVVPVKAPDRTLIPPQDARVLGWWADGALPGARRGSALVAGHTLHSGGGALQHLEDLRPGDDVAVRTRRTTLHYDVQRVRIYSKGELRRDAQRLFSQDVPGRLVLVTCEEWDGDEYLSNVVVIATPRQA